jgi:tetratricopeptide (TPR) repeat protein
VENQLPNLQKPPRFAWIASIAVPLIVFTALGGALKLLTRWRPASMESGTSAVFRQSGGGWQRLPALPGRPQSLRVSPGGTVWASTWTYEHGDTLARLRDGSWQYYTRTDFGTRESYGSPGFVLDGEEVWLALAGGVVHWGGHHWQLYAEVAASAIVASPGTVWAIDRKGALSRFAGGQWKTLTREAPGGVWDEKSEYTYSTHLACTSDGALWLVHNGLWRFDGAAWRAVTFDSQNFAAFGLLGATGDRIWLWDDHDLRSISMDGKTQTVYGQKQTGLARAEQMYEATARDGHIYFAAWRGILEFDGAAFHHLTPPKDGVRGVFSLRSGPGGELWALGYIPNPRYKTALVAHSAGLLAILLAMLAVPVWMVRRHKRDRLREHQHARQAVEHATGAAPEQLQRAEQRLTKESSWWGASVSVSLPLISLAAYSALRAFWRSAPSWSFLLLAAAFHVAYVLWRSLAKRTPKPWDPIEPGGPGYDWGDVRKGLPGTIGLFLLMNFDAVNRYVGDPFVWVLRVLGVWGLYHIVTTYLLNAALKRGDYDAALTVITKSRPFGPNSAKALKQRGLVLLLAGRYREAEDVLRRALAGMGTGPDQAAALERLGDALLEQGRYDEAMRSFQAALHAHAGFRRPYRGMAELLLRQRKDPPRALEYVENIVGASGPSRNKMTVNGEVRDDYWALKAWALAEAGRTGEVADAVENAIRHTDPKSRPAMAATYHRIGMAMQAMGNEEAANGYFKQAQGFDPRGRWNALAKAASGERSVFRA